MIDTRLCIDPQIQERINKRKRLSITTSQLANRCGVPKSTIWRFENGRNSPMLGTLNKIDTALSEFESQQSTTTAA